MTMPPPDPRDLQGQTWAWASLLTGLLVVLVVLPPFLPAAGRTALYLGFSPVCHQLDARSFHLHGHAFAVCHRCTGIFAGLLAGTFVWPIVRRYDPWLSRHAVWMLALSLLPAAFDWLLGATGLWLNTPVSRSLTGALFGMMAGVYLARGWAFRHPPPTLAPSHPTHSPG